MPLGAYDVLIGRRPHISSLRPLTLEKEIRSKPVAIKSKDNHAEYG
jgi:hypothetical protein